MEPASKPQVTWEDQQNINKFSNVFQRQRELEVLISQQRKLNDDLEDAGNELMLADDDEAVKLQVGQCFWATGKEDAEARLEQLAEESKQELQRLEQELQEVQSTMSDLRTQLYARLGDSINLDVPHKTATGKA